MKILMVSHEYPPIGGGGANACMFLASEYAKQGHNVTILTVWYEGEKEFRRIASDNDCGDDGAKAGEIDIYRVKSKRKYQEHCSFVEMFDFLIKAFPLADKLARNENIDICQVFFGIPSGPIGFYLKKKHKIPYVIRFGGGDIPGFQNRFEFVYKILSPFIKCIWNNADALVANSEGLKKLALEFSPKSDIQIIHNGVDLRKYVPAKRLFVDNTIRMLFVSRLIERKGLQYLIPHLDELQRTVPSCTLNLTIVGDGPYRPILEELAGEVKTKVVFAGQKQKDELLSYYQNADVFVFPSRKEGMPNVVLEAMACGLPIVMNNCEGSEELVDALPKEIKMDSSAVQYNQYNGLVSEDQNEYFVALERYLKLTETQKKLLGNRSREKVENNFSWEQTAKKYSLLFENILLKKN